MAGTEISAYATELAGILKGVGATVPEVTALTTAAHDLETLYNSPSPDKLAWNAAVDAWKSARQSIEKYLAKALLGVLADIPGIKELAQDAASLATSGINGSADLGPVHLEVASATLYIQPPTIPGVGTLDPVPIGPFAIGQIAASLASPFGSKSGPGGGSIVRLPGDGGYGGTLELPLGPVKVSAAAILSIVKGQPSFLAILGVEFLPPIQLSFGFSLDRVGGIVGLNRRVDTDALRAAVRTGSAGDVLFAVRPPKNPLALVTAADKLFPSRVGTSLVGPSLKLSWLSFGSAGSLIGIDLAVIVEIPTGKIVILGVARVSIPTMPLLINLRLDVLGIIDPVERIVSIDASLVDSHVLGIFSVYGDAAARFSWGDPGYTVVSIGGFFPGFTPEPAKVPALRRVGLALDNPIPIITVRAEGYFAITSNSIQFGGRWEIGIEVGIEAHGFLQVDAMVQFRPFHFDARVSAGFDVSAGGFSFASVTLSGSISGPGPIVITGSLSIDVFLFSISWDQTFTLGSGPSDQLPTAPSLLDVLFEEFGKASNLRAASIGDATVVLKPRASDSPLSVVPPTGSLEFSQRRSPLGVLVSRVDGRPLASAQRVAISSAGTASTAEFSIGSFTSLSASETLNAKAFEQQQSGQVLALAAPALDDYSHKTDETIFELIALGAKNPIDKRDVAMFDTTAMVRLRDAAGKQAALSDTTPLVTAQQESWVTSTGTTFGSAAGAVQQAKLRGGVAMAAADAASPVSLAGVL